MIKSLFQTAFLLRRLLKAQERQALALEQIRDVIVFQYGGLGAVTDESGDPTSLSYASDTSTYKDELEASHHRP